MIVKQGKFNLKGSMGNGYATLDDKYAVKILEHDAFSIIYVTRYEGKSTSTGMDGSVQERISFTPQAVTYTEYTLDEVIDFTKNSMDPNPELIWIEVIH